MNTKTNTSSSQSENLARKTRNDEAAIIRRLLEGQDFEDADKKCRLLCIEKGLVGEMFSNPPLGAAFDLVMEMAKSGHSFSRKSFFAECERRKTLNNRSLLDDLKDGGYYDELAEETADAYYAVNINRVLTVHLQRKLESIAHLCHVHANTDYPGAQSLDCFLDNALAINRLFRDLYTYQKSAHSALAQAEYASAEYLKDVLSNGTAVRNGLSTGFNCLDSLLDGLKPGSLNIIGARPSVGKSALAMNIAESVATGKLLNGNPAYSGRHGVYFVSLEMTSEELITRLYKGALDLPVDTAKRGYLHQAERDAALQRLEGRNTLGVGKTLFVDDTMGRDINRICSAIEINVMDHQKDIQLIVIDYLQLASCDARAANRTLEIGAITAALKQVAIKVKRPILLLSQLNRDKESDDREPRLSDLRDSGSIEQDADTVILLNRPVARGEMPPERELITAFVAKNRNGPTGKLKLAYTLARCRFSEDAAQITALAPLATATNTAPRMTKAELDALSDAMFKDEPL